MRSEVNPARSEVDPGRREVAPWRVGNGLFRQNWAFLGLSSFLLRMANPWLPRWDDPAVRFDTGWRWPSAEEIAAAKQQKTIIKSMKRQNYYPSRITDQIPWLENFRTKVPGYVTTLGLVQAKVDANVAGIRYLVYVLSQWLGAVRAFGPASTEAVDLLTSGSGPDPVVLPTFTAPALPSGVAAVPPGVLERLFELVREIKEADGYTEAMGLDLGIIGAGDKAQHAAPAVRLELQSGSLNQAVKISFVKYGHMGVFIESRRGTGSWEFLGIDTLTPYVDDRPLLVAGQPEVREYRVRFWDKGTPNGDWTDVAKISVAT